MSEDLIQLSAISSIPTNRRFLAMVISSVLLGTLTLLVITRLKLHVGYQSIQSRKVSSAKFVDLPLEILVEILLWLELKDTLHVRQTCQRLHAATLARPVWLSLVHWYSATIKPRPFMPEKPLSLYMDRELEQLVIRWQSGKAGWSLTQPHIRTFSFPKDYFDCTHLIEGGRWLLYSTLYGTIKYWDLNALDSDAVTLVPSLFDEEIIINTRLSIDLDPDAEYLTFNLGIMTSPRRRRNHPDFPNPPRFARWIQIIRVTSEVDSNGEVTGLRATCLARFREEYLCGCDSFTLRGHYVAYSLYTFEPTPILNDGESIAIVDWTVVDPTSLAYPRRLIWRRRAEWLALLPDNRFLCHSESDFLLFDLNAVSVSTLLPTQQGQTPRQPPAARLHLYVHKFSKPYHLQDCTRFSVLTNHGVKGLTIRHSSDVSHSMDFVELLSDKSVCTSNSHLGYDRAVVSWPRRLITVQYVWPKEGSHPVFSQKNTTPVTNADSNIVFDESSGRIVIYGYDDNKCIDLAMT